jgi:hypothetical protein
MSTSKVFLSETTLDNIGTLLFLSHITNEDRKNKHIWDISDNSLVWEDQQALRTYFDNDFGKYHLYIAYRDKVRLGLFGMLNLSDCDGCANILMWVDSNAQKGLVTMKWFVHFLHEAQKKGVTQWYAKIKLANTVSLNSSKRYGFVSCGSIPQHLLATNRGNESVLCVTRMTSFNGFERKYIERYMPNLIVGNA